MKIETTMNLRREIFEQLNDVCHEKGMSKSDLLSMIITEEINSDSNPDKTFKRVKYQERAEKNDWNKVHIRLVEELYEMCQDLRKSYKMSVSYIVTVAIIKYLNKIRDSKNRYRTDNYHSCYIYIAKNQHGKRNFIIYWYYPGNETLLGHL